MARSSDRTEPTEWLTDDQRRAWMMLSTLMIRLPWALDAQLSHDSDLSFTEYYVLVRLSEEPERRMRMSTLAELLSSSLSRLSHMMKRLEKRGWTRREPDPDNRRYTVAVLTDDGFAALEAAAPGHVDEVRKLLIDPLTDRELKQLRDISTKLVDTIDTAALFR